MKKTFCLITVLLIIAMCFVGCAAKSDYAAEGEWYDAPADAPAEPAPDDYREESTTSSIGGLDEASYVENDRKLIYTSEYTIETKSFEADYNAIIAALEASGGFLSGENTYGMKPEEYGDSGRHAELTLRIPVESYKTFLNELEGVGSITRRYRTTDDVTTSYYDNEARIELYEAHYEKLMGYLENASDINDIIAIESEMTDVLYTLDSLKGEKRHMDDRIEYCTVYIYLNEVVEYTEVVTSKESFASRVGSSFMSVIKWLGRFFEGFAVVFIAALPILAILAAIFSAIFFPVRAAKKKKKALKEKAE